MVLADVLEAHFGKLEREARRLAVEMLGPAVASGDQAEVARVLGEIDHRLHGVLPDGEVEEVTREVAIRHSTLHAAAFFPALAKAVGVPSLAEGQGAPPALPPGRAAGLAGAGAPRRRIRGVLVAKLSAEPRLLAERFATKNAILIRSLREEVVPALRDEVVRAVEFGVAPADSAARLVDKWSRQGVPIASGNLQPRVHQIVGDQIAKLHADLNKARMTSAGITDFRWITRRDDRVRPEHEAIDGDVFSWASGHPTEGLPGEPYGCRCFAEAVIDRDAVLSAPGFIHLATAEVQFESAA